VCRHHPQGNWLLQSERSAFLEDISVYQELGDSDRYTHTHITNYKKVVKISIFLGYQFEKINPTHCIFIFISFSLLGIIYCHGIWPNSCNTFPTKDFCFLAFFLFLYFYFLIVLFLNLYFKLCY